MFDPMTGPVLILDSKGRLLRANRAFYHVTGLDPQSAVGLPLTEITHPDGNSESCEVCSDHLAVSRANEDVAISPRDQIQVWLHDAHNAQGEWLGTMQVIHDVAATTREVTDERQQAEQAMHRAKLRALRQFAWGIAHSFNNSLTPVLGYTQLVLNKITDPVIQRHLKTVEKSALDAAKMVQRIQSFARQGKVEAAGPVDLNQIIRDALDLTDSRLRDDARAAGIAYDVNFRPEEGVIAVCDQSAISEVFVSIIINAIEAMPDGGRLTITTAVERNHLLVTFVDTGSGMTAETRQRIFEPFYTTKGAKSQGIGLAAAYGIVDRHGGEIHVTSEPGHGSTFTVRLVRAPEPEPAPFYADADLGARPSSVLVVNGENPIRVLLSNLLRARGHRVMTAEDGVTGLRAVENVRFDMVITDLSMPGADGWTVIEETRRRWPETKLVILTDYGSFAELVVPGANTRVVDALVSKSFNIAEIDLTLNRLLVRDEYTI